MMELGDYGERCIPVVAGILGDWLDDSRARLRTVEQERDRLLGVVDGIFQDFEDLLVVATKDVDADGFVSAYHFKTGAIHRMLGKVRQRYGLTTPVASPPQGIPEGGTMRDSCGYPKKDTP
jgi:hypothetical protein